MALRIRFRHAASTTLLRNGIMDIRPSNDQHHGQGASDHGGGLRKPTTPSTAGSAGHLSTPARKLSSHMFCEP